MSADQTPGRPTEQEWALSHPDQCCPNYCIESLGLHNMNDDEAEQAHRAIASLIARVEAAARAEGQASAAGPVLALAAAWAAEATAGREGSGRPLLIQTYDGHARDLLGAGTGQGRRAGADCAGPRRRTAGRDAAGGVVVSAIDRATLTADVLELVREWTQIDGRLVLVGRDLQDFRDQIADVIAGRAS